MRVTSPPAALLIAAAFAVLTLLAHPSSAGAGRWQRPVPGEVTRSFHYSPAVPFAPGAHRGADLAAAPGDAVVAACAGVVAYAGPVPGSASAVTLRCGDRRVTHLPLRRPVVRRGVRVRAGDRIGTLAAGHGGLHLGVRAAADPFAYEDPLPLLPTARDPIPSAPLAPGPARPRPAADPEPISPRRPAPVPSMPPLKVPARPAVDAAERPLAPPLAWAGLALAALATTGTGALITRRRATRTAPTPTATAAQSRP